MGSDAGLASLGINLAKIHFLWSWLCSESISQKKEKEKEGGSLSEVFRIPFFLLVCLKEFFCFKGICVLFNKVNETVVTGLVL